MILCLITHYSWLNVMMQKGSCILNEIKNQQNKNKKKQQANKKQPSVQFHSSLTSHIRLSTWRVFPPFFSRGKLPTKHK